jgi:hypothetical protein
MYFFVFHIKQLVRDMLFSFFAIGSSNNNDEFFAFGSFKQLMMNPWVCRTGLSVLDAALGTGSLK